MKNLSKKQSAARVKKARRRLQWSQAYLGKKLLKHPCTISAYENPLRREVMRPADLIWLELMAMKVPKPMRYYVVKATRRYYGSGVEHDTKYLIMATSVKQAKRRGIEMHYTFDGHVVCKSPSAVEVKKYIYDILRKYF